jgi:hypothetical protein
MAAMKDTVYGLVLGTLELRKTSGMAYSVSRGYIIRLVQSYYEKQGNKVPTRQEINSVLEELIDDDKLGMLMGMEKKKQAPANPKI